MASIKVQVKKEVKKVHRLMDYSSFHDFNLNKLSAITIMGHPTQRKNTIKILEEGLRIPFINIIDEMGYLDTMIEYKGKKYFTMRRFIKEEIQEDIEEKELQIPDIEKMWELSKSFGGCLLADSQISSSTDCLGIACPTCIFFKSNAKYFRR